MIHLLSITSSITVNIFSSSSKKMMLCSSGAQSPVGCPHIGHGPGSAAENSTPRMNGSGALPTIQGSYTTSADCGGTRKEGAEAPSLHSFSSGGTQWGLS